MKKKCVVVTQFKEKQVGFLDFFYRIKSLTEHFDTTVVGPYIPNNEDFESLSFKSVILHEQGFIKKFFEQKKLIKDINPDFVVLLSSSLSPLTLFLQSYKTVLYWNEHPTHLATMPKSRFNMKFFVQNLKRKMFWAGARNASLVMAIGEALYDDLLFHGVSKDKVSLVYMGVDDSFRLEGRSLKDHKDLNAPIELVYVGSVKPERGRDVMIESVAKINKSKHIANLTIVGASEEQITVCNLMAKKLGVAHEITVFGRVSGKKIPEFLNKADFGLCLWEDRPWWRFNPPTKLFEYLVAGVPVLASDIRTHTEYITDWQNGLVFKYNADSLARKILEFNENRSKIQSLKEYAERSGELFLWSKVEKKFLQDIEILISSD